jgi:hypothetical protein
MQSLAQSNQTAYQATRQPPRARVSAACKKQLAKTDARIALMSDTELFAEAELALRDTPGVLPSGRLGF